MLYLSSGLSLDGGIASVARSVVRSLDRLQSVGRIDRALTVEVAPGTEVWTGANGVSLLQKARFAVRVHWAVLTFRPDHILFEHLDFVRLVPRVAGRSGRTVIVYFAELSGNHSRVRDLRAVDLTLAISEFTRSAVLQHLPSLGSSVGILPIGIEPSRFEAWRTLPTPPLPLERASAILIVSRLELSEGGKGHDHLIAAMPLVAEACPESELWIVGGGDGRATLEELAEQLGVASRVVFHGRVSDDELVTMYRSAAVFAMPSRQEGFGLVYLEAFAHGLPCVASDCDAGAELVRDGLTGRTVPYGSPVRLAQILISLLKSPNDRQAYANAGQRLLSERMDDQMIDRVLADSVARIDG